MKVGEPESNRIVVLNITVLRLYPILPLFGRVANKDTFLPLGGGPDGTSRVFVPKGTLTMINTHTLHRRSDVFGDDSDEFKPERWESLKTLNHWSYLPFGGGPRVCIGRKFSARDENPDNVTDTVRARAIRTHGSLVYAHSITPNFSNHEEPRFTPVAGINWDSPEEW